MKINSNFYYIVQTDEGKDLNVKQDILKRTKLKVYIPLLQVVIPFNGIKFLNLERALPEYLILEKLDFSITKEDVSLIEKINGFLGFMGGKDHLGLPVSTPYQEVKKFLENFDDQLKNKEARILSGTFSGYHCKILKNQDELCYVQVLIKNKPRTELPVWALGII